MAKSNSNTTYSIWSTCYVFSNLILFFKFLFLCTPSILLSKVYEQIMLIEISDEVVYVCMYVCVLTKVIGWLHVMFVFEFLLYKDFYERHSGVIIEREESDFQVLRCSVIESFAEVRWVVPFTAAAAWATSFTIP